MEEETDEGPLFAALDPPLGVPGLSFSPADPLEPMTIKRDNTATDALYRIAEEIISAIIDSCLKKE